MNASYAHGTSITPLIGATIGEYLDKIAGEFADNEALVSVFENQRFTYRHFLAEVNRYAAALSALGVQKGDRVGIWSTNYVAWVLMQFATAKIGAILEALGGFPEIPIMEDIAFGRQLRRAGRLTSIHTGLVTSGRRWDANGVIKTTLVNWCVTLLFFLRVSPPRLRRLYDRWLVSGRPRCDSGELIPPSERKLQEQP